MFPDVSFLGIDLYALMITIGIIAATVCFRLLADAMKLPTKPFNFFLLLVVGSVAVGFLSAILFQSLYNFLANGVWKWQGMTFLGGLIGGAGVFLLLYLPLGRLFFKDGAHKTYFIRLVCCVIPCIVLGHAFGRIGCLFSGCCYGIKSEQFGLPMRVNGVWENRLPTQLFESLFLFALFAVLTYLLVRKDCRYIAQIYLICYGVWRFIIEYFRDDPRGSLGVSFLSPSQLISLVMIAAGIVLIFVQRERGRRNHEKIT